MSIFLINNSNLSGKTFSAYLIGWGIIRHFLATIPTRNPALMRAMDKINTDWGSGMVTLAAEGMRKAWKLRQENISKRYTTRWGELAQVKI